GKVNHPATPSEVEDPVEVTLKLPPENPLDCARDDQHLFAEKVGSIFARPFLRLLFPPCCNLGVISTQQDLRNFPTTKFCGTCVLRCLQESPAKTVVMRGLFVAENTGD